MNGKIEAAFIGTCGRDAETRIAKDGCTLLTTVSVAVGEQGSEPYWIRCALFGEQGEQIGRSLTKGAKAYFEGFLTVQHYETRDGQKRVGLNLTTNVCQPVGQIGRRKQKKSTPGPAGASAAVHRPMAAREPELNDAIPF